MFSTDMLAQTVVCSTKGLVKFDPHLDAGPFESYLSSQLYLPFFSQGTKLGVIKSQKALSNRIWELKINPGISFQNFQGWKPTRKLNADDVVFSINRQLEKYATRIAQKESFNPAKLSGLEKTLVSARAKDSMTVELTFNGPKDFKDIESMFRSPSGIVVSKEYFDSLNGKTVEYFPANGTFEFGLISPTRWEIKSRNGKDLIRIIYLESARLNAKVLSTYGCKRLYYPPKEILNAVDKKTLNYVKIPISISRLYFRLNSSFPLNKRQTARLPLAIHTDRFPSLKNRRPSTKLFSIQGSIGKPPEKQLTLTSSAYVYVCEFPQLDKTELRSLQLDFAKNIREGLGIEITFAPIDCDQLAGIRPYPDTLGVLNVFERRSQTEIKEAFDCDKVSREIFGICQSGKIDENVIDRKLKEVGRIFPLAHLESFMIESF